MNVSSGESYFIAIDGDDIGIKIRNYIIANDVSGVATFSKELAKYFEALAEFLLEKGCRVVFCGGDSILGSSEYETIINLIPEIISPVYPISVGIGKTAEMAYIALQLAKARGKSQVVVIENTRAETIKRW